MRAIRSKGTKPELAVRRLVHRLGYRFRLHITVLPGRPDMVFVTRRKVVFVHGCFWHQHTARSCNIARKPKTNLRYWGPKLKRNAKRDVQNRKRLRSLGWSALVLWECSLANEKRLTAKLRKFLD